MLEEVPVQKKKMLFEQSRLSLLSSTLNQNIN